MSRSAVPQERGIAWSRATHHPPAAAEPLHPTLEMRLAFAACVPDACGATHGSPFSGRRRCMVRAALTAHPVGASALFIARLVRSAVVRYAPLPRVRATQLTRSGSSPLLRLDTLATPIGR